ncbi:hypothetical protein C3486_21250 [Streptomyces sp. Ru73]|nr:hypothetical protein C3486_21250 [Streptomyces sp. Ru73]
MASRLDLLFETVYPAALGRPWTNREVSEASGVTVARIAGLRRGRPVDPVHRDPPQHEVTGRLADRLNHLLERRRDERGQRYSMRAVARSSGMSSTYLDRLLDGRSQPTLSKLAPLAAFLRVDIGFFAVDDLGALARHFGVRREALTYEDDAPAVTELMDTLEALRAYRRIARSPVAVQLAFRMAELPAGQAAELAAAVEDLLHDVASAPPDDRTAPAGD